MDIWHITPETIYVKKENPKKNNSHWLGCHKHLLEYKSCKGWNTHIQQNKGCKLIKVSNEIDFTRQYGPDKNTILHIFLEQFRYDYDESEIFLEYIIAKKVFLDPINKKGETPLMLACSTDSIVEVDMLIRGGAVIEKMDNCKNTALLHVIFSFSTDIWDTVHSVLSNVPEPKKFVNRINRRGKTALIAAIENERFEIAKLLLNKWEADPNYITKNGFTALHAAIRKDDPELIENLLEKMTSEAIKSRYLGRSAEEIVDYKFAYIFEGKVGKKIAKNIRESFIPHLPRSLFSAYWQKWAVTIGQIPEKDLLGLRKTAQSLDIIFPYEKTTDNLLNFTKRQLILAAQFENIKINRRESKKHIIDKLFEILILKQSPSEKRYLCARLAIQLQEYIDNVKLAINYDCSISDLNGYHPEMIFIDNRGYAFTESDLKKIGDTNPYTRQPICKERWLTRKITNYARRATNIHKLNILSKRLVFGIPELETRLVDLLNENTFGSIDSLQIADIKKYRRLKARVLSKMWTGICYKFGDDNPVHFQPRDKNISSYQNFLVTFINVITQVEEYDPKGADVVKSLLIEYIQEDVLDSEFSAWPLAVEYYEYMTVRSSSENKQHELSIEFYYTNLIRGSKFFFGVYHNSKEITHDIQNPKTFRTWKKDHC